MSTLSASIFSRNLDLGPAESELSAFHVLNIRPFICYTRTHALIRFTDHGVALYIQDRPKIKPRTVSCSKILIIKSTEV